MTTDNRVFKSGWDDQYYFWLGDRTVGPYEEYAEAHLALTKALEEAYAATKEGYQSRCI